MKIFIPTLLLITLFSCNQVPQEQRSNIIFIMADDLGYGDLGCYGQEHILSPHIDQLASEGMRFTQCYSGAAVCAPARSVLMTGQHAGYTLVRGNFGLGEPKTSGEPNAQGFDEFYGFLNQRRAHSYYPDYLWKNREKDARAYAAMITRMDRNVGLIMEAVKEVGIHENTIVFFTSDNGAAENTHQWPFFQSSGKLRGVIRDPYEGGIRVPMIVSYPGKISPGSKSELPWYFADVLPTLGALSGSQIPDSIDGISVLPTLMGAEQNPGPRPLYWEFYEMQGWRAVRFGPWKAIQQNMHHQTPADIELYHLDNDPGESANIADLNPDKISEALALFLQMHTPSDHYKWDKR